MSKIEDLQKEVTPPGIYFNMSNEDYHADKSISNSGMGKLLKTPLHYWHESPFNPDREKLDTQAMKTGRAYHTLMLEPHKFADEFKIKPGVQNTTKAGMIGEGAYKDLLAAVNSLKADKVIHSLFTDGYPEVSIFWIDEETGVPCRVRIDYLTHKIATDLKSTADISNYKLGYSITDFGYHRQSAFYLDGIRAIKEYIKSGKIAFDTEGQPTEWLKEFVEVETNNFAFVFQEKTAPYVARADVLCPATQELGGDCYKYALKLFKDNYEKYGNNRWPSGYEGKVGLIQLDDLPPKIGY